MGINGAVTRNARASGIRKIMEPVTETFIRAHLSNELMGLDFPIGNVSQSRREKRVVL